MSDNFYKLKSTFQSLESIKSFLFKEEHSWKAIGYGFDLIDVPGSVILDPVIHKLVDEFGVNPYIFKTPAHYWYKWHLDAGRTVALNTEIYSEHSHTIFGTDADYDNKKDIEELIYDKNGMYLLNTQRQHSILNLGNTRFIFGLGFRLPVTYDNLKEYCISDNL